MDGVRVVRAFPKGDRDSGNLLRPKERRCPHRRFFRRRSHAQRFQIIPETFSPVSVSNQCTPKSVMKLQAIFCCLLSSFILATTGFAQGPLPPPGPPAPTMKTLDQIDGKLDTIDAKLEKRTPIASLPFTISTSGSYYLTGNLQFTAASGHAITISVSNVTLDLMGFTLSSSSAVTGDAIHLNGAVR